VWHVHSSVHLTRAYLKDDYYLGRYGVRDCMVQKPRIRSVCRGSLILKVTALVAIDCNRPTRPRVQVGGAEYSESAIAKRQKPAGRLP
jgi:hypothetical protein